MTYREALFFIGKCLTLRHYPERTAEIRDTIRSASVDWEKVVWVSTGQFVFPALYLQLKRAGLLGELPSDLVEYMDEFAGLNRERNHRFMEEASEVAALLNRHGITPVFLKGTAHLLDGLYEDIAERQVGDMDLLVGESEMVSAAEILIGSGYQPLVRYNPRDLKVTKHYPRLINPNRIAAVEIHRQLLSYPSYLSFDSKSLIEKSKRLNRPFSATVLSDEDQIIHHILNVQINDLGYYYARVFMRQGYDLLLLSQRVNPLKVVTDFGKYFHRMNGYLAVNHEVFGHPATLSYRQDFWSRFFLGRVKRNITYGFLNRCSHTVLYLIMRIFNYVRMIVRLFYDKDARSSLFTRMSDPRWYLEHIKSYKEIF